MGATDLVVKNKGRTLIVTYADGTVATLDAEYLRVESPSAEVQGHNPSQKQIVAGKQDVAISGAEPVGNYAVRLTFSDGHSTGIFTWDALKTMAQDHPRVWAEYLAQLAARGLSR